MGNISNKWGSKIQVLIKLLTFSVQNKEKSKSETSGMPVTVGYVLMCMFAFWEKMSIGRLKVHEIEPDIEREGRGCDRSAGCLPYFQYFLQTTEGAENSNSHSKGRMEV